MWISKKEYEYLKSNQKPIHYDSEKLSEFFERQTLRQENGLLKKKTQEYINKQEQDQMTIRSMHEIIVDLDKKLIRAEEKNKSYLSDYMQKCHDFALECYNKANDELACGKVAEANSLMQMFEQYEQYRAIDKANAKSEGK